VKRERGDAKTENERKQTNIKQVRSSTYGVVREGVGCGVAKTWRRLASILERKGEREKVRLSSGI